MANRIEEFGSELQLRAKSPGGVFTKVDLHVHSPLDSDYEYKGADAVEKLGCALASGEYAIAAIVEHDCVTSRETLDELQKFCPAVTLLPGAEINLFVETMDKKVVKDHFFHCLVVMDPKQSQDYNYVLDKAKDKFMFRKSGTGTEGFTSSVADVASFFCEQGALFIPAHLHQAKAPSATRSIDDIYDDSVFLPFVCEGLFSALEVREATTAQFFDGTHKTPAGQKIPQATCVRSSDAHSHEHILARARYTWVKCEERSFQELREALALMGRTRLAAPSAPPGHIIGMHISGQFIQDEWIQFNAAMNCLIGCKGSGKTAILECLRFVLGDSVPTKRQEEVSNHISHILGSSGFVSCLVETASGEKMLLTRRADSPSRLMVNRGDGSAVEVQDAQQAGFRASVLGWHEIEGVADDATARMTLVDRVGIEDEVQELYRNIDAHVEAARDQLPDFQRKLKRLDEQLKHRNTLRDKRKTLQKLEQDKLTDLQQEYEALLACEQRLAALGKDLGKASQDSRTTLDTLFGAFADDFKEAASYPERIQPIVEKAKAQHSAMEDIRKRTGDELASTFTEIASEISSLLDAAKLTFSEFRSDTYDPKVNALPSDERDILTRQILIIEETKSLPEIERQCAGLAAEIRQLASVILDSCKGICSARDGIVKLREDVVARINAQSSGTHAELQRSANKAKRKKYVSSHGEGGTDLLSFFDGFGSADSYSNLRDLFKVYAEFDIEASDFEIESLLWEAELVAFLSVVDDDDVELSLVLPGGNLATIQNVSAGQRCTAIFPLLVMISEGPLVIDQPEDNLDNRHIASVIAPKFLSRKDTQQFVLTSHNANLVVLTDSELIMHVESDSSTGGISQSGFLACPESPIKQAVLEVLDGGEQALLARKRKYGIY